jgi:hypothetical protein
MIKETVRSEKIYSGPASYELIFHSNLEYCILTYQSIAGVQA